MLSTLLYKTFPSFLLLHDNMSIIDISVIKYEVKLKIEIKYIIPLYIITCANFAIILILQSKIIIALWDLFLCSINICSFICQRIWSFLIREHIRVGGMTNGNEGAPLRFKLHFTQDGCKGVSATHLCLAVNNQRVRSVHAPVTYTW